MRTEPEDVQKQFEMHMQTFRSCVKCTWRSVPEKNLGTVICGFHIAYLILPTGFFAALIHAMYSRQVEQASIVSGGQICSYFVTPLL